MISDGVKIMFEYGNDCLMPHFIYCYETWNSEESKLCTVCRIIANKMADDGIKSAVLTMLSMKSNHLVTKEKANHTTQLGSIIDDLELFFQNFPNVGGNSDPIVQNKYIRIGKDIRSFLLPLSGNDELNLNEEKNQGYLNTFGRYVHCTCLRKTFHFTLDFDEKSGSCNIF